MNSCITKIILFSKKNWKLVFIALLVSFFIGFPEVFLKIDIGEKYQEIPLMGTDAEEHYLATVREVYDDHSSLRNVYANPKDLPYVQGRLGEKILGLSGKALGLSVVQVNSAMKFLSPFALFFLIYYFVLLFDGRKRVALLSSLFILLGSNLVARPREFFNLISSAGEYKGVFNNYFRSINPQISSVFLFSYFILFYKFLQSKRKLLLILLGIILGLSFYLYFFTWTFLLVFTFIFLATALLERKKEHFWKIGVILLTAGIVSTPFWLNFSKTVFMPEYQSVTSRFVSLFTHSPFFSKLLAVLSVFLVVILFNYFKGRQKEKSLFGTVLIFSVLVVYNQQIITGKMVQSGHYHLMITIPLVIIFTLGFFWDFLKRVNIFQTDFFQKSIVFFATAILLVNCFNWQVQSYYRTKGRALDNQDYRVTMDWLNANTKKDETVFSSRPLSDLIPIFTPLNIYPSGYALYYLINDDIFKNQLFLEYRFRGITSVDAEERFYNDLKSQITKRLYTTHFGRDLSKDEVRKLVDDYSEFYAKSWTDVLAFYPIDYLIFDQKFSEFNNLAVSKQMDGIIEKTAELDQRFLVYKMLKK